MKYEKSMKTSDPDSGFSFRYKLFMVVQKRRGYKFFIVLGDGKDWVQRIPSNHFPVQSQQQKHRYV